MKRSVWLVFVIAIVANSTIAGPPPPSIENVTFKQLAQIAEKRADLYPQTKKALESGKLFTILGLLKNRTFKIQAGKDTWISRFGSKLGVGIDLKQRFEAMYATKEDLLRHFKKFRYYELDVQNNDKLNAEKFFDNFLGLLDDSLERLNKSNEVNDSERKQFEEAALELREYIDFEKSNTNLREHLKGDPITTIII